MILSSLTEEELERHFYMQGYYLLSDLFAVAHNKFTETDSRVEQIQHELEDQVRKTNELAGQIEQLEDENNRLSTGVTPLVAMLQQRL